MIARFTTSLLHLTFVQGWFVKVALANMSCLHAPSIAPRSSPLLLEIEFTITLLAARTSQHAMQWWWIGAKLRKLDLKSVARLLFFPRMDLSLSTSSSRTCTLLLLTLLNVSPNEQSFLLIAHVLKHQFLKVRITPDLLYW